MTPTVSVCVQTYNHEAFITECLDGILMQQTTFPFEVILGEDESSDGTREICKAYAEKHPDKIKLFLRSRKDVIYINGNPTGRFNFLENLKVCEGKYIALCEGDDYWTDPLKLQKQVDFMEGNPRFSLCCHRAELLRDDDSLSLHPIPKISKNGEFTYADLLKNYNFITTASVLFRRPGNLKFPKWFLKVPFGDLGLYQLVSKTGMIKCLDEVMSVYRIHNKGVYSKLTSIKKREQYLSFYSGIYPSLTKEEQDIVKKKRLKEIKGISKLKFPNSKWLQFGFKKYAELKYSIRT